MAQRDDKDRQQQRGSTGQRSAGQGGGHLQVELPADHGGQLGGKAGLAESDFWLKFLAVYDSLFLLASLWMFESLVVE